MRSRRLDVIFLEKRLIPVKWKFCWHLKLLECTNGLKNNGYNFAQAAHASSCHLAGTLLKALWCLLHRQALDGQHEQGGVESGLENSYILKGAWHKNS